MVGKRLQLTREFAVGKRMRLKKMLAKDWDVKKVPLEMGMYKVPYSPPP